MPTEAQQKLISHFRDWCSKNGLKIPASAKDGLTFYEELARDNSALLYGLRGEKWRAVYSALSYNDLIRD